MARKIPPGPLAGKQPDGEQVLAEIKKSERETIVVKTSIYHGYFTVHLRLTFQDKAGEWHYTREGVTLKPNEELDKAIQALAEAREIYRTLNPAVTSGTGAAPVTSQPPSPPPAANGASSANGALRVYDEGGPYAHLSHEQLRDIFVPRNRDGTKREATPAEQAAYDAEVDARLARLQRRQFPDR